MERTFRRAALAALLCAGCGGDMTDRTPGVTEPQLSSVTPAEWQRLAARRIFFAHQSVGANVMDGIAAVLKANPAIPLHIAEVASAAEMNGPGLYHKKVGTNGKPETKLAEFDSLSRAAFADSAAAGVAMLKFCYVDVKGQTDPNLLFEQYKAEVDALRAARPGIVIVHVTMPLWVDTGFIDHWGTIALGKATPIRQLNAARHRFNTLMRQAYGGKEPLFDLAAYEAIGPDGAISDYRYDGARVPGLAKAWTTDGGHLNDAAKQRMAEAFLITLAKLP